SYLSPDFTHISTQGAAAGGPNVAKYQGVLPTTTQTKNALGTVGAPTGADVFDPTKWVPLVPNPSTGYLIVGWTNWKIASCYTTTAQANQLIGFLTDHMNLAGRNGDKLFPKVTAGGFVPVSGANQFGAPTGMAAAIRDNFTTNNTGNNLNINNATTC